VAPEQLGFVQAFAQSPALAPHTSGIGTRYLHGFDAIFRELHGTFHLQRRTSIKAESPFSYNEKEIMTLTWLAPWAISALLSSDYYELDCSFKALRRYVYSIPLAVKANVGVPFGIVIAPSERRDLFSLFAELLTEKGFSQSDLLEMPLLSDAGTALRRYAQGVAGRGGYHRHHYLCYRQLLEALGSDTLVALLARRLLFTRTENGYKEAYPRAVADFVLDGMKRNESGRRTCKAAAFK
jgi:hypothetical protein